MARRKTPEQAKDDVIAAWNRRSLQRETWMRAMERAAVEAWNTGMDESSNRQGFPYARDLGARIAAAIRALPMPEGGE
jgi:hypothetical protein